MKRSVVSSASVLTSVSTFDDKTYYSILGAQQSRNLYVKISSFSCHVFTKTLILQPSSKTAVCKIASGIDGRETFLNISL